MFCVFMFFMFEVTLFFFFCVFCLVCYPMSFFFFPPSQSPPLGRCLTNELSAFLIEFLCVVPTTTPARHVLSLSFRFPLFFMVHASDPDLPATPFDPIPFLDPNPAVARPQFSHFPPPDPQVIFPGCVETFLSMERLPLARVSTGRSGIRVRLPPKVLLLVKSRIHSFFGIFRPLHQNLPRLRPRYTVFLRPFFFVLTLGGPPFFRVG